MNIKTVLALLNEMVKQGVIESYAIGGAVAATHYLEPIATLDVDVFVDLQSEKDAALLNPLPILEFMAEHGHKMEGEYVVVDGWPVQFLGPSGALGDEAMSAAITVDVEGIPVRIFRAEHLAAIALETGRAKDLTRLLTFIESRDFDSFAFNKVVQRHGLAAKWVEFKKRFFPDA